MISKFVAGISCALFLAACGGGLNSAGGTLGVTTGGATSGGTTAGSFRAGTLNNGSFSNGQIFVATPNLSAGGQTSLRVDIVDENGQLALGTSATVAFISNCSGSGRATINPASLTTSGGSAAATYVAQGCVGSDTIVAQVTISGDTPLAATGSVSVQAAQLGSIQFVSATPGVVGVSGSLIANQSTIIFKVVDASGGAVADQLVSFSLSTNVGGLSLTPTQATSDSQGQVQTVLQGGTAHATVSVIATALNTGGQTISKPSAPIAVTTGLPTSKGVSVSASRLSIDGTCDGEPTTINVRLADRYGNPVPQNTAPTLVTEGGKINGSCVTGNPLGDPGTEAGVCSVLLVAQNPRPADGRITVLAYVPGEESFVDSNGNGYFDAGESSSDLPEVFEDDDESKIFKDGDYFFDANGNGAHDGPDGKFEGYVCDSPGVNCKTTLTTVGNSPPNSPMVIVFSDRKPVLSNLFVAPSSLLSSGTVTFTQSKELAVVGVTVIDGNGNPLPQGTTYTLKTTSGSVLNPATVGPFNTNDNSLAANTFEFNLQSATVGQKTGDNNGLASLTVDLPVSACTGATSVTFGLFQIVGPDPAGP